MKNMKKLLMLILLITGVVRLGAMQQFMDVVGSGFLKAGSALVKNRRIVLAAAGIVGSFKLGMYVNDKMRDKRALRDIQIYDVSLRALFAQESRATQQAAIKNLEWAVMAENVRLVRYKSCSSKSCPKEQLEKLRAQHVGCKNEKK